jgi:uncharacterized damage-inducible protein DinB
VTDAASHWTAPLIDRMPEPGLLAERATLEASLEFQRQTFLLRCAGLSAEQLRRRAVEPSSMSLLGLLRHLADVERWWFRMNLAGEAIDHLYITEDNLNGEFDDVDSADAASDYATYLAEVDAARMVAAPRTLEDRFVNVRRSGERDLRWVYLHLIEEYARHNGHSDLLRERIDGVTGE